MSGTVPIVTVNASVVQSPQPNALQQRGAFVTQGGTNTANGSLTLCSTLAALTALLSTPVVVTSLTWASNVVTVVTSAPHGWTIGDVIPITIAGAVPAGYNGTYTGTVVDATHITYPLASSPGAETTPGTIALGARAELLAMGTTYFAGSGVPAVYVLELGEGEVAAGVAALTTFIGDVYQTTDQIYAYLVPREWDSDTDFLALCNNNTGVDKMTYFWVTTTYANRAVYSGPAYKCVYAEVDSPGAPTTEFPLASAFGTAIKASPSSTNKLAPLSYAPSFGTTAYPLRGNQSTFSGLALASVGWIGTGQQGGVAGNILYQGKMSDGNFWNFWYSVDWAQINMAVALANEVINGSATSLNPLYYNQDGINRLQNRVVQIASQGVTAGLGNGQVIATKLPVEQFRANYNSGAYEGQIVVNAEPFLAYTGENPSDYGIGKYAGLSCVWIPQLPFLNIFFNLQATTLITGT
jgi:hypothetical protein